MIKVYSGQKGFTVLFLFIAGIFLILSLFIWGISEIISLFYPLMVLVGYLIVVIFTFAFLPVTLIKDLRPLLANYALWMGEGLGLIIWTVSFFYVIKNFGLFGIFAALFFKFLIPTAVVLAVIKSSWHMAGHLILWSVYVYIMRLYSQYLPQFKVTKFDKKIPIIDIEAKEV